MEPITKTDTPKATAKRPKMPQVYYQAPPLGCDPEFFFSRPEVGVIGAEAIIPKAGMITSGGKIVIDGVQAELNPAPNTCRESVAYNIVACFRTLKAELDKNKDTVTKLDFSRSVDVSPEEMAK